MTVDMGSADGSGMVFGYRLFLSKVSAVQSRPRPLNAEAIAQSVVV
jgi:hypothetical protein